MKWDSSLYDNSQHYVSEYGNELLNFIPEDEEQTILDLGCGTGDLTNAINYRFKTQSIKGIDSSLEMIEKARSKYGNMEFEVCDAMQMPYKNEYDVIISNAVLHWIKLQNMLHRYIYQALKENGLFICEFGGSKNIYKIKNAFRLALKKYDDTYENPFYFPSVKDHTKVVLTAGFTIENIYDFDRPTPLPNGEYGLRQWVCQFFSDKLRNYRVQDQEKILQHMEKILREELFDGYNWIADYRRIRVIARKN